jgi:hypothetical protein
LLPYVPPLPPFDPTSPTFSHALKSPPTLVHLLARMADSLSAGAHIPLPHSAATFSHPTNAGFNVLAELPQLFIKISTLSPVLPSSTPSPSSSREVELVRLILKSEKLLGAFKKWFEGKSGALCPTACPDVLAAVLDCNASAALLTLSKMLAPLQRARSRLSSPEIDKLRVSRDAIFELQLRGTIQTWSCTGNRGRSERLSM